MSTTPSKPMEWTTPLSRWVDEFTDRLNPIFVKETRQVLKSRQFVITFLITLISSWLISVVGVLLGEGTILGSGGRPLYFAYCIVLTVAMTLVIPVTTFNSLSAEREMNTLELLTVSTMSPVQLVWGKLWSAVLQMFLYLSAVAPFMAFTYLLRGIDIVTMSFTLFHVILTSIGLTQLALVVGSLAKMRFVRLPLLLAQLGVNLTLFAFLVQAVGPDRLFEFGSENDWLERGIWTSYFVAYLIGTTQIARAQLTFEADNRSSGIRLSIALISLITIIWIEVLTRTRPYFEVWDHNRTLVSGAFLMLTLAVGVGPFVCSEPESMSRRVRTKVSRWGSFRFLLIPFLPGSGRGLLFLLFLLIPGPMLVAWHYKFGADRDLDAETHVARVAHWSCLAMIYIGLGSFVGRIFQKRFGAGRTLVLTVVYVAVVAEVIHFIAVHLASSSSLRTILTCLSYSSISGDFSLPHFTRDRRGEGALNYWPTLYNHDFHIHIELTVFAAGCLALFVAALNSSAIIRGVREVIECRPLAIESRQGVEARSESANAEVEPPTPIGVRSETLSAEQHTSL